MPVEAKAGLRPRTCMYVNARDQRMRGIDMHACPRPKADRGQGRCDKPRPEAETSMFCARTTLPRFHIGENARGPHAYSIDGIYVVTNTCMYARTCTNMHVALSWHINERPFFNDDMRPKFTQI
eukprot:165358-Chlamydomonas_euryale.AAC.8